MPRPARILSVRLPVCLSVRLAVWPGSGQGPAALLGARRCLRGSVHITKPQGFAFFFASFFRFFSPNPCWTFSIEVSNYRASTETCNYHCPAAKNQQHRRKRQEAEREGEWGQRLRGHGACSAARWPATGKVWGPGPSPCCRAVISRAFQLKVVISSQGLVGALKAAATAEPERLFCG